MHAELKVRHHNGCLGAFQWYNGALVKAGLSTANGCSRCSKMEECILFTAKKTEALFPRLTAAFKAAIRDHGYENATAEMLAATKGEIADPTGHTAQQNWRDGNMGNLPGAYYQEMSV